ncbi:MAG: LLM class flavin-dependent oxidoreductase, partial [Sphaerobacter thermophilus]
FADAGFPVEGGVVSDDLLDHLVVWGDEGRVQERLAGLLGDGIDELLVMAIPVSDLAQEEERLSRVLVALAN